MTLLLTRTWASRPRSRPRTQNLSSRTSQGQPRPKTTTLWNGAFQWFWSTNFAIS